MKVTITREQLQEGLVAVAASVPAKTTLPILSNILLEATKDGIRLSGTDLDISVSTTVSASVDQEGAITLPARKLVEIVRELPNAAIRLTASGEQRVGIECGRSRFKLLGLPREEFPAFPTVKFEGGWRTSSKDLQKLIAHVAFAASTEESRPILNGVLWELRPERMRMVATNGHRLARMDVPTPPAGSSAQADLIVPPKALEQIRRLFRVRRRGRDRAEREPPGLPLQLHPDLHPADRGTVSQLRAGDSEGERQVGDGGQGRVRGRAAPHEHRGQRPDSPDPDGVRQRLLQALGPDAGPGRGPGGARPFPTRAIRSRSASTRPTCSRSSSTSPPTRFGSPSRLPSAPLRASPWAGTIRRAS